MDARMMAQATELAARRAEAASPSFTVMAASDVAMDAANNPIPGPAAFTAPGRQAAYEGVGQILGLDPQAFAPGQQTLVLDGGRPQSVGASPWRTS